MTCSRAVLFDLDGTLLDRERSLRGFARDQYRRFNDHFSSKLTQEEFTARLMTLDNNGRVWKDEVYKRILGETGIAGLGWQDLLRDYEDGFCRFCQGFPGLRAVMASLRAEDWRLGLISNGPSPFQERNFEALGVSEAFGCIVVSGAVGVRKPDPRIFELALKRLGAGPEESVFVGDNPEADIAGARGAGLKSIWMRNRHWPQESAADAVCDRLAEIPRALEKLV